MSSRLINIALSQYGIKEVPGVENNPEIMKYFKATGHDWVEGDETSWCSAAMNWCAIQRNLEHSDGLTARGWLKVGHIVEYIEDADIVAFWRESLNSWKGHVGIPINEVGSWIWTLGGNQSNMFKISPYPLERKLAYIKLFPT